MVDNGKSEQAKVNLCITDALNSEVQNILRLMLNRVSEDNSSNLSKVRSYRRRYAEILSIFQGGTDVIKENGSLIEGPIGDNNSTRPYLLAFNHISLQPGEERYLVAEQRDLLRMARDDKMIISPGDLLAQLIGQF